MLDARVLTAAPGVAHGFFTRRGGVGTGVYASLNCALGTGDDPAAVAENRARVAARLGADALLTAYQHHGAHCQVVETPWADGDRPRADALATKMPGVALAVLTADCAPVLLCDPGARVVAAAHAGWRGALAGVLEATVAAMTALGADKSRIVAAVGPCIGRESYEVGPEFAAEFIADDAGNERFFDPAARPGHRMFDLAGYVAHRLDAMGLAAVAPSPADTRADAARFFSYRRTRQNGGAAFGCQISAIAIVDRDAGDTRRSEGREA